MLRSSNCLFALLLCVGYAHAEPVSADQRTLAQRGSVTVVGADLEAKLGELDPAARLVALQKSDRLALLLDSILLTLQMAAEGQALNLHEDPIVKRQMELAALEILGDHYLRHELNQIDPEERRKGLEQYAREQFIANRESFGTPAVTRVRHLLVSSDGRSEAEVQERIALVQQRLRDGEDFQSLVMEYSDDRSKHQNAGVIDVTAQGDLVESFKQAALALGPAIRYSEPVKSPFGTHIIEFLQRTEGESRSFDEVKDGLMSTLSRNYDERRKQLLLSRMRADKPNHDEAAIQAYVESLEDRLRALQAPAAAGN